MISDILGESYHTAEFYAALLKDPFMVHEVEKQRLREICKARSELLEQRESVTMWQQEIPGNPTETRYLITLNDEEVAKFSVYQAFNGTKVTVGASPVEYYPCK